MTMLTIHPYLLHETWVFDDPRTGLKEEAFVCGATEMISRLVEEFPRLVDTFEVFIFLVDAHPDHHVMRVSRGRLNIEDALLSAAVDEVEGRFEVCFAQSSRAKAVQTPLQLGSKFNYR